MRWKLAAVSPFAFMLAVGGCASYHPKPISPADTASAFESRRLSDPGLRKFLEENLHHEIQVWPKKSWDLTALHLAAFYYHPDLEVARAQWGVAKAGVVSAGGRPNPTLQISPEFSTNPGAGVSPWVLGFNLDIPIETAGKRRYRIAEAKHHAEASRFNIATVAWQVRSRVREVLLGLFAANQTVGILEKEQKLQEENVTLLEGRTAAQQVSPFLTSQAEASSDQSVLNLSDAKRQEAESRARLADAVGLPLTALDGTDISFDGVDRLPRGPSPKEIQSQALTNRPDLLAALEEYTASESALQLEIAKQYPDIHIGPGYLWDQGQHKWTLGLSMTLPIFNRNKGPITEAEARRTEVSARFLALQDHVIGEVSRALAGYRGSLAKLKAAEDLLSAQKKKFRFIDEASGTGELRRVALLSAQVELDATTLNRLNALVDAQRALGQVEDAVQKPLGSWGQ